MVFYFTATGNSLYVAKQLDFSPISIPRVRDNFTFTHDSIGIVCPVYCGEIPALVQDFIKKSTFKTDYLYLVLTYGMSMSDCPEFTFKQCRKVGVSFDYIGSVKMADNYLPGFDMKAEREAEKNIDRQISRLISDIETKVKHIPTANAEDKRLHKRVALMNKFMPSLNNGGALRVTSACRGCGLCQRVCPVGNIVIENGKARRKSKSCQFCLACIHACDGKGLKLKMEKNPNERYRNEHISLEEIIEANNQRT